MYTKLFFVVASSSYEGSESFLVNAINFASAEALVGLALTTFGKADDYSIDRITLVTHSGKGAAERILASSISKES